jgi:lipoyl(octanoyl) transferase
MARQVEIDATLDIFWLGRREYREVWALQQALAAQRLAGEIPDTLLLLEHPPTITLGRAAQRDHIVASAEQLERMGVTVVESDRGGDVTYHGPGQLVGYPILNLREPPHTPDLHAYLRRLEECLISALSGYGIRADRFPGYTGVWVGREPHSARPPEKIAAIGVKAGRWITMHGFALNVCPDLAYFDLIVPCGIHDYGVTSMTRLLSREVTVEETLPVVSGAFISLFRYSSFLWKNE